MLRRAMMAGAGKPESGHRHWRANVTAVNGASATSAAEFGLRDAVGGASIAIGGVPSAKTTYGSGLEPGRAFDGNPGTLWSASSGSGVPSWLAYDFGRGVDIVQVAYTVRSDAAENQAWRDFDIQYSDDGVIWKTAWSVANQTGWALGETRVFTKP